MESKLDQRNGALNSKICVQWRGYVAKLQEQVGHEVPNMAANRNQNDKLQWNCFR